MADELHIDKSVIESDNYKVIHALETKALLNVGKDWVTDYYNRIAFEDKWSVRLIMRASNELADNLRKAKNEGWNWLKLDYCPSFQFPYVQV